MWELISANRRKSWILFWLMGFMLVTLGAVIAGMWAGPDAMPSGAVFAIGLWMVLSAISFYTGDAILLAASNAREVTHDVHPELFNVVEEMKIAASLPAMPKIYIIDEAAPNAFAVGRNQEKSAIVVTAGLLAMLDRDQLQGVIAHEMSHIINRDVLFVTFAGVMLGAIVMLSEVFLRSMRGIGTSRRYRSGSGGGQAQIVFFIAALVAAILAPILARIFYFAISRRREYLADASAARLTRYPEGLAGALEQIAASTQRFTHASSITAPMYIVNPLQAQGNTAGLFSTHPPTDERIRILRSMAGANLVDYANAFSGTHAGENVLPASAFRDTQRLVIRAPTAASAKKTVQEQARAAGDLMRAVSRYSFLACTCGLKVKVPADFKSSAVDCPRCGRVLEVPCINVGAAAHAAPASTKGSSPEGALYARTTSGWESFRCMCNAVVNISPIFIGTSIVCPSCGRKTTIVPFPDRK